MEEGRRGRAVRIRSPIPPTTATPPLLRAGRSGYRLNRQSRVQSAVCTDTTAANSAPSPGCGPEQERLSVERPARAGRSRGSNPARRRPPVAQFKRPPASHDRGCPERRDAMSYLRSTRRRPASVVRRDATSRVDEKTMLNLPEFDGGAHVRVLVEDTTARRRRRVPSPRLKLRIADCVERDPPRVLGRLRGGARELAPQGRHADHRAGALPRRPGRRGGARAARAPPTDTKGVPMSYLRRHRHASRTTVGTDPGLGAGAQHRRRLRLGGRRLDAAAALPRSSAPRAGATTRRSRS